MDAGQCLREPGRDRPGGDGDRRRARHRQAHARRAGPVLRPGCPVPHHAQPAAATSTSWRDSVAAAQASGDTEALAYGMAAAARSRLWDGWIDEALGYADAAITATEALGPRAGAQLAPHVSRGICLAELDRDAEADRAFEDALRLAERGVGTDYLAWRYLCAARLRFCQGRWDEALAEVHAGLDLPDLLDMGRHLRGMAAVIAVHRRDRAALAGLLPALRAPPQATSPGRQSAHMPAWALALAAEADGRSGEAAAILSQAWGDGHRPGPPVVPAPLPGARPGSGHADRWRPGGGPPRGGQPRRLRGTAPGARAAPVGAACPGPGRPGRGRAGRGRRRA